MSKIISIFLSVFLIVFPARAQQKITKFEDGLGVKGEIRHTSALHDSLLPQNGKLDMRWRELNHNDIKTFQILGQTREHLPVGKWSWEEGIWNYKIRVGNHAQPAFNSFGIKKKWEGHFSDGMPEGRWEFTIDSIGDNGKVVQNLSKITINYKNGIPHGVFSIERNIKGNALKVNGHLDSNGIATGTWSYRYFRNGQPVREERIYKYGLLTHIKISEGSESKNIQIDLNTEAINHITIPERNNESRQIGSVRFQKDDYTTLGSELVHELLTRHYNSGWKLEVFPFEVILNIPEYHKVEFPLNDEEHRDILICKDLIAKQRSEIEQHLSGNIYIHRSKSGILDTTIAYLQLQDKRLAIIDSILNRTETPLFTYKNRFQQGIQNWIAALNDNRFTRGEVYDSLSVEIPEIMVPQFAENVFDELKKILLQNEDHFLKYYTTIIDAKSTLKKEGLLKSLEDTMMIRIESLQHFYGEKSGVASIINNKWLKGDVQDLLQIYANTSDYDSAMKIGSQITFYLDSLQVWKEKVNIYDSMPQVLRKQYSYMLYNPYTGINDIELIVKKKFLNNVLTLVWPYMMNSIKNEPDWNKWTQLWNQQFAVYHYLLSFTTKEDKQSKRLENKVRRESKPDKMLKMILNNIENH